MSRTLFLIPTQTEFDVLQLHLAPGVGADDAVELCGFGLVASAARAAQLIAERKPQRVLLVGIAGTLNSELSVGEATAFRHVACCGVGVGTGADFVPAGTLGWHQFRGRVAVHNPDAPEITVGDSLELQGSGQLSAKLRLRTLLSVTAASANPQEAGIRRARFPDAVAEDMEGFGVAVACRLAGVPLEIIRGISNAAGDREKERWQIETALEAAGELALRAVSGESGC